MYVVVIIIVYWGLHNPTPHLELLLPTALELLGGKAHRAGTFNEISSTFQHQCGVLVGGPRVFWLNNQRYYILGPETWLLSV
jgi:hypothetical protein